jgi:16S rRNA (uracil1498-N3)-methyltransferase
MNIILFSPSEVELPLSRQDSRARHILTVLRRRVGDEFDAGVINGPRGRATLVEIGREELRLGFKWTTEPPPLLPIHLVVGLPRPQTARDLLREGATLGVGRLDFVRTARGEASYASSSLWTSGEAERLLVAGASQAFCTRLPQVTHGRTLADAVAALPPGGTRLALDNYAAATALAADIAPLPAPVTLALGAERGWTDAERELLRSQGFQFRHLGPRVLRMETAAIAAVTLVAAKLAQT